MTTRQVERTDQQWRALLREASTRPTIPPWATRWPRAASARLTLPRWVPPALRAVGPLCASVVLWLLSLPSIDPGRMSDLGLVSVLPLLWWVALVLAVTSAAFHIHRGARGPLILAHLVVIVLIIHATPELTYHSLRYGWAWKHVGIVDYIVRNHGVDPTIGGAFAAYHSWPGFFALNALVVAGSGLTSALAYAGWAPVGFELAFLGPVVLLCRTLAGDTRRAWLAVLVFCLSNWVGQDYFSPQAFAYLLHLTVLALCLRCLPSRRDPAGLGRLRRVLAPDVVRPAALAPNTRRLVIGIVVLLILTIVSSHQLTPFMLTASLVLLVLGRQTGPAWLPWFVAGTTLAWMALMAQPFLGQNLSWILASVGHFGGNTTSTFVDVSHASTDQLVVSYAGRGLSALVGLLAVVGAVRLRRHGQPYRTAVVLAVAPMGMLAANDYGGEMLFRTYLFAVPFLGLLAAGAVYPSGVGERTASTLPSHGRLVSALLVVAPVGFVLALILPFTLAYYGKERANYFSPGEVAASAWLYDHTPAGAMVVAETAALPWAYTRDEDYQYAFLEDLPPAQRAQLGRQPLQVLAAAIGRTTAPVYVVLGTAQDVEAEYTGVLPRDGPEALRTALSRDPSARTEFTSPTAIVYSLTAPPTRSSP